MRAVVLQQRVGARVPDLDGRVRACEAGKGGGGVRGRELAGRQVGAWCCQDVRTQATLADASDAVSSGQRCPPAEATHGPSVRVGTVAACSRRLCLRPDLVPCLPAHVRGHAPVLTTCRGHARAVGVERHGADAAGVVVVAVHHLLAGQVPHLGGWRTGTGFRLGACLLASQASLLQERSARRTVQSGNHASHGLWLPFLLLCRLPRRPSPPSPSPSPSPTPSHTHPPAPTLTVLSSPPDTASRPSGENWHDRTQFWWPVSVYAKRYVGSDHTWRVKV